MSVVRAVVIGTAGHIDHGKSALVRALTGTDPDRLKEEQARGITIDLGFAHLLAGDVSLAFVDVPGHERFVKNMLAGAGGTDLVMLVVAADESVKPQTREHFEICRLLQVPAGLVVLTKADLVDEEMLDLVALDVRELVAGSFLAAAPIVPVSARSGQGLAALRSALVSLAATCRPRREDGPPRLPIDRVFSMRGFGTVATGTLVSGTIRQDQELTVLPRGTRVKVRGLQQHGVRVESAAAGTRVAVNLGGIEVGELARGDTLTETGGCEPTRRLDARLEMLPGVAVKQGMRIRFHHGTSELLGRVAVATSEPGDAAVARIRLESPAVVTRGDRFILRAYSPPATIGGGVVLDPQPPRGAIRTAAGRARLARLDGDDGDAVLQFVEERGAAGLPRSTLVARAGLSPSAAARVSETLVRDRRVTPVDDLLVAAAEIERLEARLVDELKRHHASQPLSEGMPREEARGRTSRRASPAVFDLVLDRLTKAGRIVARDRLALREHQVSLSDEETSARLAIERVYREAKLTPPEIGAAASAAGVETALAGRVATLLVRSRTLVKLDGLLYHQAALDELKAEIRALKARDANAKLDVASFKVRYGVSRKYAIPLLEYLDRERVTRRVGESRVVL